MRLEWGTGVCGAACLRLAWPGARHEQGSDDFPRPPRRFKALNVEELLVYQCISRAGNVGESQGALGF